MPFSEVRHVSPLWRSLIWRLLNGLPESSFRVFINDGSHHDLILHRDGEQFVSALESHGVLVDHQNIVF